MRKVSVLMLVVVLVLMFSGTGFAIGLPLDQPLGEKQEHLFFISDVPNNEKCYIRSFIYVEELNQIQILYNFSEEGVVFGYDLAGKPPLHIAEVEYPDMSMKFKSLSAQSKINSEVIVLTQEKIVNDQGDGEDDESSQSFEIRLKSTDESTEKVGLDIPIYSGRYGYVCGLYTTKDYIVIYYMDEQITGHIERYTYGGVFDKGVTVNARAIGMVEGPAGSTLYIQKSDPQRLMPGDDDNKDDPPFYPCDDPIEMVQINWEAGNEISSGSGPRPVIQEQTRAGHTIARFTDSQFGLLRMEDSETGIVDYQAPIRSKENLVKLQIPYCDIKAKLESGARNLMVEYQGQTLRFPMELFECDDMLAAMPCQDEATIEIIIHMDEAGNVTCEVQMFVVEQVNAMTRVVHRKTIQ